MSTKKALLVGLCQVSPAAYNGWNGANGCEGCELDVENVERILTPFGYEMQMLKTAAATKPAILNHLEKAAQSLQADDMFVFYYAGHGGQQPDADSDETDNHDETLLAYDGEITDDELNQIWPRFQPGVRIVMLSDSCNSGTNYRDVRDVFTPTPMQALPQGTRAVMQAQLIHFGGCRINSSPNTMSMAPSPKRFATNAPLPARPNRPPVFPGQCPQKVHFRKRTSAC
jgi:hypothetical protein